ncbi:hypothetical protein PT974_01906 [Cladobotryum mycophilum]|uniref:Myb-like domain-containing protein n=1 Tax=Cladobotryum mycophilum TaxID=491253 RepID=A0ABR0SWR6_9HYPO
MVQDLKPWIARALAAGRKPLPETRPRGIMGPQPVKVERIEKPPATRRRVPRRSWSTTEIRLLLRLKAKGKRWDDILLRFPDRSMDGIKQTYWKYRSGLKRISKTVSTKKYDGALALKSLKDTIASNA